VLVSELIRVPQPSGSALDALDLDLPMLLRPADVGGMGAWQTMLRDGLLRRVHLDTAVMVETPITADIRAAVLAPLVPVNCYLATYSATWIYCGGPVPPVLTVAYPLGSYRPRLWTRAEFYCASGLWAQSRSLGIGRDRVRVTTPVRTAVDLALRADPDAARDKIRDLAAVGTDLRAALRSLELRGHTAGGPQARQILAELLAESDPLQTTTSRPLSNP